MVFSVSQMTRTVSACVVSLACVVLLLPTTSDADVAEPAPEPAPQATTVPEPVGTETADAEPTGAEPPPSALPVESAPETDVVPSTTLPGDTTTVPETLPGESSTTLPTDETTTTVDPAAEESGSRGGYSSQPPFVPDSVDPAKVAAARQKLTQANQDVTDAAELIAIRDATLEEVNLEVQDLAGDVSELVNKSADLRKNVHDMAVANFQNPTLGFPRPDIEEPSDAIVYRRMVEYITTRSDDMATQFDLLNAQLTDEERRLVVETSRVAGERDQAQVVHDQRVAAAEQAEIELATYEAAGEFFVPNAVFPVGPGVTLPLINSYGFDRARGTPDSHWHEGIDIFGPRGTDLYAAESGVITNVGSGRLGGLVISLVGDSGTRWYYAHLDGFAPGLTEGQVVQAGDVIGFLGDSGNARGTDPHLHLEIHPPEIRVINPYPQLNVLIQRDLVRAEQNQIDGEVSEENVSLR